MNMIANIGVSGWHSLYVKTTVAGSFRVDVIANIRIAVSRSG